MKKVASLKDVKFSFKNISKNEEKRIKGGGAEKEVTCTPKGNRIDD